MPAPTSLRAYFPPKRSVHDDWRGPMTACPDYRLEPSCRTRFPFWEMFAHEILGEGRDLRDVYVVEYLPPGLHPRDLLSACEWIVPDPSLWS